MIDKVFFDTAIFIYALEAGLEEAQDILENAIASDSAVTSTITLMEYSTGAFRRNDKDSLKRFQRFLEDNYIAVTEISRKIALRAGELRGEHSSLKSMDALQLACAIENKCDVFYSNDNRLKRINLPEIEIRTLRTK